MNIPLPKLMRHWREHDYRAKPALSVSKLALRSWAFAAKRPRLYRLVAGIGTRLLSLLAGRQRSFRYLLLAGAWTKHRDLAAPAPRSFQSLWQQQERKKERERLRYG
jgi:L-lactate dehydrogenase complex protein LldF